MPRKIRGGRKNETRNQNPSELHRNLPLRPQRRLPNTKKRRSEAQAPGGGKKTKSKPVPGLHLESLRRSSHLALLRQRKERNGGTGAVGTQAESPPEASPGRQRGIRITMSDTGEPVIQNSPSRGVEKKRRPGGERS